MSSGTFGCLCFIFVLCLLIGFPLMLYYLEEIHPKKERDKMIREMLSIYKMELNSGIPKEKSAVYDKIKNVRI